MRGQARTVAIVQARLGSSRLPGKVLMPIGDRPMLRRVIERLEQVAGLDRIVIATSTEPEDREIVSYVRQVLPEHDVTAVDDATDVLARYVAVAAVTRATVVVRVTSDCPLIDPVLVNRTLDQFHKGADYASNCWVRTFPDGLDVEVLSAELLAKMAKRATDPRDREHVTRWVFDHPAEAGVIRSVEHDEDLSALRWTVDTADDLEFVREVYRRFDPLSVFAWQRVLALGDFARRVA